MSGIAGSGKTTIVIHKLLSDPNVKKLHSIKNLLKRLNHTFNKPKKKTSMTT
jgi:superfamily I DNA and RNA helicase